jgi:hypothetical protein
MKRREGSLPLTHSEDAAAKAVNALGHLFSSRDIANKAHFRCSTEGPTDLDVLFESVLDDVFGRDPSRDYKRWIRSLFRLGLISRMPTEWLVPKDLENSAGRAAADNGRWRTMRNATASHVVGDTEDSQS